MTVFYGEQNTLLNAGTVLAPGFSSGTVRCFVEEVTMAGQTTSDTIVVAKLPKGAIPLFGILINSATMGASATVAIGITGSTGKYRAAATKTSITPEVFGVTAGLGEPLTADEEVFVTIGAASLPGSGTFRVMMFYAFN